MTHKKLKTRLDSAILALEKAHHELTKAKKEAKEIGDWGTVGSLADFIEDISGMLLCDKGEAGLKAWRREIK